MTVQRLQPYAVTIFAEMSALAMRTGSINLGQGFPDVDGPEYVKQAAIRAIEEGRNQYAPGDGVPELRRAIGDPDTETRLNTLNEAILERVQGAGEAFVSNAVVGGRYLLRACVVNINTTEADIDAVPDIVVRAGRELHARPGADHQTS